MVFTCVGNKTRMDLTSGAGLDLNEWGQVRVDRTDLHVIGKKASIENNLLCSLLHSLNLNT